MKKNKNQYVQANKDWLVEKSKEDGVKALPKGVYYKVLAEGDHSGATPSPGNVITAHGLSNLTEEMMKGLVEKFLISKTK